MSLLTSSTTNEKRSLAAHVDLCALRYAALESKSTNLEEKTDKIEAKIDRIDAKIDGLKSEMTGLLIKGGAGLILILLSALAAISKVAGVW
jgi:peptidoglycan hydrolase CwlO-like protein